MRHKKLYENSLHKNDTILLQYDVYKYAIIYLLLLCTIANNAMSRKQNSRQTTSWVLGAGKWSYTYLLIE